MMLRQDAVLHSAIAASLVLPVAVLGLEAPLWVALAGAIAVLAGGVVIARPRTPVRYAAPLAVTLRDARPAVAQLARLSGDILSPRVGAHAASIAAAARDIEAALHDAPARLGDLHRVFTYYLPRAAALADAYALLETRAPPDRARMDAIAGVLGRIDHALKALVAACAEDALAPLDVELRLIDAALREDLER